MTAGLRHAVCVAAGIAALACSQDDGGNRVTATGTLEIVEVDVGPSAIARVVRVPVDEGQQVRAGDTLAILAQPAASADVAQRAARVEAARASLDELLRGTRPAEQQRAAAEVRTAQAEVVRADAEARRLRALKAQGFISAQQLDNAETALRTATGRRDAANATLRLVREGTRLERITAARAQLAEAQAALSAVQATVGDLVLLAPMNGLILSRNAEPGEILTPPQPALTMGDVTRPWARVYVNARDVMRLRLGDPVRGSLDGTWDYPVTGRIAAISPRAEYTPRVALTEHERADLMFAVKVTFENGTGALKAGLPIDVRIHPSAPPAMHE